MAGMDTERLKAKTSKAAEAASNHGPSQASGAERSAFATAATYTSWAPAASSALEQAAAVAPVVITSSTSRTRRPRTWRPARKADCTFWWRCSGGSEFCTGVARTRLSHLRDGSRSVLATAAASSTAALVPRTARRRQCIGTGTTTSTRTASRCSSTRRPRRLPNAIASGSPAGRFARNTASRTLSP